MFLNRTFIYKSVLSEAADAAVVTSEEVTWPNDGMKVTYENSVLGLRVTSADAGFIGPVTSHAYPSWNSLEVGEQLSIAAAVLALEKTTFFWGLNKVTIVSEKKARKDNLIAAGMIVAVGVLIYLAKR